MKKIVSLALACMLMLSCFAFNAFAAATDFTITASEPDASGIFSLKFVTPVDAQNVKLTFTYPADKMTLLDSNKEVVTADTFTMEVNCDLDLQASKNLGEGQCQAYAYRSQNTLWAYAGDTVFTLYFKLADDASITECPFGLMSSKSSYYGGLTVQGTSASTTYRISKDTATITWDWENLKAADEPEFGVDVTGTTLNCWGKVDATVTNYGVEFTADSTVNGARAQKYYGAMNGDTVKDYNGATTFTFGDWDGTFSIVLEGVHAGDKTVNFFANDTAIADTTFTVTVE